jgi:PTH1 family peptidyl-tRNA hydrolase
VADKCYLVVGLGNIGAEYATTRHNVGFMILDAWAQASNVVFESGRYGDMAVVRDKGREFHLLKPSTYMNLSGNAVRYWLQKLEIPRENLMVICDDINLPFGTIRLRAGGSDGGHNGLAHIEEMLGDRDWARLRIGIGHDFALGGQIDYVLGSLSEEQRQQVTEIAKTIVSGLRTWSFMGIQKAMSQLNSRPKEEKNEDKN